MFEMRLRAHARLSSLACVVDCAVAGFVVAGFVVAGFLAGARPAMADERALADFYGKNKITIAVGFSPGGNYDLYARVIARHMGRAIPGGPDIIVQNMPGAGSRVLANALYGRGPFDGTMIGVPNQGIPTDQALGEQGVQFDVAKFFWIGSPNQEVNVAWTWHTSKLRTLDDARRIEGVMGSSGPGSPTYVYPRVMNMLLGTRFKVVSGYPGSNELDHAIEKGEVDGRGAVSWAALKVTNDWPRQGKVNLLVQIGLKKAPDLPDLPLLHELATTPEDRQVLEFLSLAPALGRPFFMPPRTPEDRVAAVRKAFDATMKDAAFLADAERSRLDVSPLAWREMEEIVNRTLNAPRSVVERAREAMK
jgi:tripartite-type tricarboxylate transporter receptor subunit TctC